MPNTKRLKIKVISRRLLKGLKGSQVYRTISALAR